MQNRHLARAHAVVLLAIATLVGCQASPPAMPPPDAAKAGPEAAPATAPEAHPQPGPATSPARGRASQRFTFDVDPMRGAAFERPTDAGAASGLALALYEPEVTFDPATNMTTVRLQAINAGRGLDDLRLQVVDPTHLVASPPEPAALEASGGTQTLAFVFDNPGGDSFSFDLDFAGTPSATRSVMALAPLNGATASSSYAGLSPGRAVDGDLNTQWADGGYRTPEAWLRVDTGAVRSLSSVIVKMRPQSGGAYYRIETSSDGVNFTPATGNLRNTSWGLETKALAGGSQGRYVRLHFFNDPASPEIRFSVFEIRVDGGGGTTGPTPAPSSTPVATPTPSASATPGPTPTPVATPTPAPSTPAGTYNNTFESYGQGASPSEFIDPRNEGYSYSWMPYVPWYVTSYAGSKQYQHDGLNSRALLSFRRYRGTALGTQNGQLPARYFSQVDVTPIRSNTYSPTGDQGTQFYYLDPTHYFELLIKPNLFEVWVANGAEPFTSRNWQRLYYTGATTAAGQKRRLSVEIDAYTNTARCYLDGQLKTTLRHPMLTTQTHFLALRGTGNVVVHDNLIIQPR